MEGFASLKLTVQVVPYQSRGTRRLSLLSQVTTSCKRNWLPIRAQMDSMDGSATVVSSNETEANALKIKEWEVGMFQNEVAANQGIRIRRRPPTGPPLHYVGTQNEGNTPRNILEEIVWNKDKEVNQLKERKPLSTLKKALQNAPPTMDFVGALRSANKRTGLPGLIAEVKKASPSRGILRENFDPASLPAVC